MGGRTLDQFRSRQQARTKTAANAVQPRKDPDNERNQHDEKPKIPTQS